MIEGLSPSEVVKVSRVGFPALRRSLERDHDVIVASAVRGLTIWDEDDRPGRAVVERPNLVGRLDRAPTHGPWLSVENLATEPMVAAAARLRKAVTQIRGVLAPPFPVEDSWFVVLLPVDPSPIAAAVDGTEVLGLSEYPGGLRIHAQQDATGAEVRQYAAVLESAIAALRGGRSP